LLVIGVNAQSKSPISISTQQNNPNPPESSNKQAEKDKNRSESFKSPQIQEISQPKDNKSKTDRKQNYQWSKTILDHLFEFLLTLFTGFLALFTYRLWKATAGLWEVSQGQSRDMKESLRIAKKSADAAKESADAFQAIEIARLFVKVKRDPPPKKGEPIERIKEGYHKVLIKIINEGKSLAIITKINWYIGVMNDKEIVDKLAILESTTSEFPDGLITIRGNDSEDIPAMVEITNSDLHKIDYSNTYLVCLGYIKYKDIFRKIRPVIFYWKDNGVFFFPDEPPKRNDGT